MKIYSPTPCLGYGYNMESFERVMRDFKPDMIAVDGGSTDPGPHYLGSGESYTDHELVIRDLRPMIHAAVEFGIPMVIGTSGGAGGTPHIERTVHAVEQIAMEDGLTIPLTLIDAEQPLDLVREAFTGDRIKTLVPGYELDDAIIDRTDRVVGLMGVEPFIRAYESGAQFILAGRADDAAIFASYAIHRGIDPASAWLAGKFLECGGACALPRHKFGLDGLTAIVENDSIIIEPADSRVQCTVRSLSNFLLHENESPVEHTEPSGVLDLSELELTQLDDRSVLLTGQKFYPAERTSIRLEGVGKVGYRTVVISWTRDPQLISCIDDYLDRARANIAARIERGKLVNGDYDLGFRLIGKNAVMEEREFVPSITSHELGVIVDVVAPTQAEATTVAAATRTLIKNFDYPGKLCDEGCITFPYSPSELEAGPVYTFSIWHALLDPEMDAMFPLRTVTVGAAVAGKTNGGGS